MKERIIEVVETVDRNITLKINNIFLHSKYYPKKEGEVFVENSKNIYENKEYIVIYGIALGYHVEELFKKADSNSKIYIFDADKEVYEIGKKYNCYNNILKDSRVNLYIGVSDDFFNNLDIILKQVDDIIVYTPSIKVLPSQYSKIKDIFINFKMARDGINKFKYIMNENYKSNLNEPYATMKDFFNTYTYKGEKIIMVAAGPSLDENISSLKILQNTIKIFCVGSALRTLMNNGIRPYMICIIDPSEIVYNQIKGFENLDIPLCFLSTASRGAVANYNGPKYMFYNKENHNNDTIINTGKTVAIPTIDIAVKGGAKEIILVGQDLAFINNKSHTDSFNESYKDINLTNEVKGEASLFKKVEGIAGETLYTKSEYLNFKHYIELEIENNPQVKFINCSSGARIRGTKEMKLDKIVETM